MTQEEATTQLILASQAVMLCTHVYVGAQKYIDNCPYRGEVPAVLQEQHARMLAESLFELEKAKRLLLDAREQLLGV